MHTHADTLANAQAHARTHARSRTAARAIKDNLLFQDLPPSALDIIIDTMHATNVPAGTDIIRQVRQRCCASALLA